MIDMACLIVVGIVTWMVAAEGIYGAGQVFLCTLLSALVAMNFFEPLAVQLRAFLPDIYCDFVALIGLFTVLVFGIRLGVEHISPTFVQVIPAVDTAGRWVLGAATGYLTMAFLLTALHTAPMPREFIGFKPERNNFFGQAPDRQWLGFVQYVSEKPLASTVHYKEGTKDVFVARPFDGRYEIVGGMPQRIWPSFPIRYAQRREFYNLNISPTSSSTPPPPPPPPPPRTNAPQHTVAPAF